MKFKLQNITTFLATWYSLMIFAGIILGGIILLSFIRFFQNREQAQVPSPDLATSVIAVSTMKPKIMEWSQDAKILGCESMYIANGIINSNDGESFVQYTQINGSFKFWSCEIYSSARLQTRTVVWDQNNVTLSSPIKIDDQFKNNYDLLYSFNEIDTKPSSQLVYEKVKNQITSDEYIDMKIGGSVVNTYNERYVWEISVRNYSDDSTLRIIYIDADSLEIL